MEELEVKWSHAVQIWWSWTWRTMIRAFPVGILAGMLFGVIIAAANKDVNDYVVWLQLSGFVISAYFAIHVLKKIFDISFNGYRIALIKTEDSDSLLVTEPVEK